ncbi:MAG: hypothetical protein ABSD74_11475 [Rhizomicrobium sp.]|jgi:hypothetical protein
MAFTIPVRSITTPEFETLRDNRAWKIKLIEKNNSGWNDLYDRLLGEIALPDVTGFPSLA